MNYLETVRNGIHLPKGTYAGKWEKRTVKIKAGEDEYEVILSKSTYYPKDVTCEVMGMMIDIYIGGKNES